jgi:hypothetical protein
VYSITPGKVFNRPAIVAVTSTNRVAFKIWPKSRLSVQNRTGFVLNFFMELLALHPQAHVIAVTSKDMLSTELENRLQLYHRRLHIVQS